MIKKEQKKEMIEKFKVNQYDTGSMEVQIALLTQEIELLTEHLKHHVKDRNSKQGLIKKVSRRKAYLEYLENENQQRYKNLISQLGIRK